MYAVTGATMSFRHFAYIIFPETALCLHSQRVARRAYRVPWFKLIKLAYEFNSYSKNWLIYLFLTSLTLFILIIIVIILLTFHLAPYFWCE